MMKYFLIYCSILSLAFYSCNKSSPNGEIAVGGEMSLNASVKGVAEVGGTVPDVNLATEGFYMAGYYTIKEFESCLDLLTPNIFNHPRIALAAVPHVTIKDGRYTLPISQHPLRSDSYLSFFAWSQSKTVSGSGVIASTSNKNDEGRPYLAVRVANKPTEQCDIVTSKHMDHLNETVITAVDLSFNHILSKVTFKLKSSDGSKIFVKNAAITYGSGKVLSEGRYGYGSKGELGKFNELQTPHVGSNVALTTATPTLDYNAAAPIMLGDVTFIPQTVADGFVTLNLTYQIYTSTDVKGAEVTKSIPLKGMTMIANNNYTSIINITASKIEIEQSLVGEWNESSNIVDSSTILLFDGRDAPVEMGGKKYWIDRSGKNNHGEILTSPTAGITTTHDATNSQYIFTAPTNTPVYNEVADDNVGAVKLPTLNGLTAMTVDIIVEMVTSDKNGSYAPFFFSRYPSKCTMSERQMTAHIGYGSNNLYFDAGGVRSAESDTGAEIKSRLTFTAAPPVSTIKLADKVALFTFRYADNGGEQSFSYNGATSGTYTNIKQSSTAGSKLGTLTRCYIGWGASAKIKYFRVRNKIIPAAQTAEEYQKLKVTYGL